MFKYSKDCVSVFTVLDTRRPKADGKYPVKVQVGFARKQKYYTTSKTLSVEEWRKLPTTKLRSLVQIREEIETRFNIVRDFVRDLTAMGDFSFDALNMRLAGATTGTINTAFEARLQMFRDEERAGSWYVCKDALISFERFGGKNITFSEITPSWLKRYEAHEKARGLKPTTISIHLRQLRTVILDASRNGIIKPSADPFGHGKYEISRGEGRKLAFTLEQIGAIARYKGSKTIEKYRDYWLFMYLCNGINMADLSRLKYCDIVDGEICFTRKKTERTNRVHKEIRVIITPPMQAVIDRWGNPPKADNYIFPILTGKEKNAFELRKRCNAFTMLMNIYTRKLGRELGFGAFSTYSARHSFATVLKRSGANIAYISESLGHSNLKTTENYLASFEREEREKNAILLTNF